MRRQSHGLTRRRPSRRIEDSLNDALRINAELGLPIGEIARIPLQIAIGIQVESRIDVTCDRIPWPKRLIFDARVRRHERAVHVQLIADESVDIAAAVIGLAGVQKVRMTFATCGGGEMGEVKGLSSSFTRQCVDAAFMLGHIVLLASWVGTAVAGSH